MGRKHQGVHMGFEPWFKGRNVGESHLSGGSWFHKHGATSAKYISESCASGMAVYAGHQKKVIVYSSSEESDISTPLNDTTDESSDGQKDDDGDFVIGVICATRQLFFRKLYFLNSLFQIQSFYCQGCTTSWNICTYLSWRHNCQGLTLKSLWVKSCTNHPTFPYNIFKKGMDQWFFFVRLLLMSYNLYNP